MSKEKTSISLPKFEILRTLVDEVMSDTSPPSIEVDDFKNAYSLIRQTLCPDAEAESSENLVTVDKDDELGMAAQEVTYASVLLNTPIEPYLSVAHTLRDAARRILLHPNAPSFSTEGPWQKAVRVALAYNKSRPTSEAHFRPPSNKALTFARAVAYFINEGVTLSLVGDTVTFSSSEKHKLASIASRSLMYLGDTEAMNLVEALLLQRFDAKAERLHLHLNVDPMGLKTDRSIPYGYLYRIALKTLGHNRIGFAKGVAKKKAVVAATNLASIIDVEPFITYEITFEPRPGKILDVLRNTVIFDELFSIPQSNPLIARRLVEGLFAEVDTRDVLAWSLRDALDLYDTLLGLSNNLVKSKFIKKINFLQALSMRVGSRKAKILLDTFCMNGANRAYEMPEDAREADTRECMLVSASKDHLWIPGALFIGPAFYNRMISLYTKAAKSTISAMGISFEHHVEDRLRQKGIPYLRGKYGKSESKLEGDVDLAIETEDTVALFELKKKNLTRATFGGSDLQLAIDLSQGFIHGFNQLARQELKLRTTGRLQLLDGSTIEWNERRILKIVLSVFDYGGLHDSVSIHHALRGLCGSTLLCSKELALDQSKAFSDANKNLQAMNTAFLAYKETTTGNERECDVFFRNSRFIDAFFFERVLSVHSTPEAIINALSMQGSIHTGRRDNHFDFEDFLPHRLDG